MDLGGKWARWHRIAAEIAERGRTKRAVVGQTDSMLRVRPVAARITAMHAFST